MKLQIKPQPWMCMVTSFAMSLDIPVADLIKRIGHDGSKIVFPRLAEPMCRRGFHVQECIVAALDLGYTVTPVELFPVIAAQGGGGEHTVIYGDYAQNWAQFTHLIRTTRGVIDGSGRRCGHAVAYDHGRIFDPDGREYDYSREACEARHFLTRCLWRVDRIGAS